jgi:hypothetical protein
MSELIDVTDAIGVPLVYDRETKYGEPFYGVEFRGAKILAETLARVGEELKNLNWLDTVESILTAGVYVNKPGEHKKGTAWDFDGFVSKGTRANNKVWVYLAGQDTPKFKSIENPLRVRIACVFARYFGVVLTEGYNKDHHDHIHMDLSYPVKWRNSKSQIILVQETLNALYTADLVVDGKLGPNTTMAWRGALRLSALDPSTAFPLFLHKVVFKP